MVYNLAALLQALLHRLLGTPDVGRYGKEEIGSSLFLGYSWNETLFNAPEQTKWKSRDKPMETWATSAGALRSLKTEQLQFIDTSFF